MLIGGGTIFATNPKWPDLVTHGFRVWLLIWFIVLFGTLLAFCLYLDSLKYLSPSETSIVGCAEPLSSAFIALTCLHVSLGIFGILGGLCIITTIFILTKAAPTAK